MVRGVSVTSTEMFRRGKSQILASITHSVSPSPTKPNLNLVTAFSSDGVSVVLLSQSLCFLDLLPETGAFFLPCCVACGAAGRASGIAPLSPISLLANHFHVLSCGNNVTLKAAVVRAVAV